MNDTQIYYMSMDKKQKLIQELNKLKDEKIPGLAKRIDEARQMGDISENSEYHSAREDMAWAQSRVQEIEYILKNIEIIDENSIGSKTVKIGSVVTVKINGNKKEYSIVGAQEAEPLAGKISNESPLGRSFIGHKKGDSVKVKVPSGMQIYEIVNIK